MPWTPYTRVLRVSCPEVWCGIHSGPYSGDAWPAGGAGCVVGGGGGLAQGLGIWLFAFGGACWPLATVHSDPLWARTCFGCVNGAPG